MNSKYTISRTAWRNVTKAAHSAALACSIANKSLIAMDVASPLRAFDDALKAAPAMRDIEGGHSWGTLMLLGVERNEIPAILEAMGASEDEIAQAVKSPEAAYAALTMWAQAFRDTKPTEQPNVGRF